jgi:UDP-2,3-diacylglucosamine pyrophosphatase LpxH
MVTEERIVVVSDVHIGEEGVDPGVLRSFLDWMGTLDPVKGVDVATGSGRVTLRRPTKVILLGDILELWAPRIPDIRAPLHDSLPVFSSLFSMDCEKIYVLGNHDEGISEGILEHQCPNGTRFIITPRHYPRHPREDDESIPDDQIVHTGIPVGAHSYFFLHGQQFDGDFENAGMLRKFPGWMSTLASAYNQIGPRLGQGSLVLAIITAAYLLLPPFQVIQSPAFFLLVAFLLGISVFIAVPAFFSPRMPEFWKAWNRLRGLLRLEQEKICRDPRGKLWKCTKYMNIGMIISKEYYKPDKARQIEADTIVFGHTHLPETSTDEVRNQVGKAFLNTGSWVPSKKYPYNTFVYIDPVGAWLLRWDPVKREVSPVTPAA